jgi:simple sugar transport system substrate-binding protein
MAPYKDDLPDDVKQAAETARNAIIDGSLHPFAGPVKNQAGEVAIAEGAAATDEELLGMNWYVEGVQGKLPQ